MTLNRTRKRLAAVIVGTTLATAGAVGAAAAMAGDDDATGRPIPATDREQAEEAALTETGGGQVTDTEVGDEESLYEVEVTRDDGTQVDVQLDKDFNVVGTEEDSAQVVRPEPPPAAQRLRTGTRPRTAPP
jgi:uncharacterized membrane protein YkoI